MNEANSPRWFGMSGRKEYILRKIDSRERE